AGPPARTPPPARPAASPYALPDRSPAAGRRSASRDLELAPVGVGLVRRDDDVGKVRVVQGVGERLVLEAAAGMDAVMLAVEPGHRHIGGDRVVELQARPVGSQPERKITV